MPKPDQLLFTSGGVWAGAMVALVWPEAGVFAAIGAVGSGLWASLQLVKPRA